MKAERPLPVRDEQSAPYWDAAAKHKLVIACCSRCRKRTHPPDVACPHCRHTDPQFQFEPVTGAGVVCSWTVLHQSFLPGFDDLLPLVLVDVLLDGADDVRLIGRLIDGPKAPLRAGARVSPAWEDLTPDVAVPAFVLDR